jgi:hypothetical protein
LQVELSRSASVKAITPTNLQNKMKQNSVKYWTNESRKGKRDWSWSRAKARITNKSASASKSPARLKKAKTTSNAKDWIAQMGDDSAPRVMNYKTETVRYV